VPRRLETWPKRRLAWTCDRLTSSIRRNASRQVSPETAKVPDEMSELNGDVRKVLELLEVARSEMVTRLAASLAITRDAQLQKRLGEIAGVNPKHEFMIGQIDGHSWLKVGGRGYTISRKPQVGLPAISLDEVPRSLPELERLLQDSMRKTHAMRDANNLLNPLFEPSPIQLRSNFRDIFSWAPLLEQIAYKAAMRALHVLDALRLAVRTELGRRARTANTGLLVYWQLIHADLARSTPTISGDLGPRRLRASSRSDLASSGAKLPMVDSGRKPTTERPAADERLSS
jgi:hypothetical protein